MLEPKLIIRGLEQCVKYCQGIFRCENHVCISTKKARSLIEMLADTTSRKTCLFVYHISGALQVNGFTVGFLADE